MFVLLVVFCVSADPAPRCFAVALPTPIIDEGVCETGRYDAEAGATEGARNAGRRVFWIASMCLKVGSEA